MKIFIEFEFPKRGVGNKSTPAGGNLFCTRGKRSSNCEIIAKIVLKYMYVLYVFAINENTFCICDFTRHVQIKDIHIIN